MPHLRLQGIAKAFQGNPVVRNVDLSIESGEFLVMVGPSGCGKTTLLRLVAGLENPDRGDIYIRDQCVTHVPPRDRNIGMVFGVALTGAILSLRSVEWGRSLSDPQLIFIAAFQDTLLVVAIIAFVSTSASMVRGPARVRKA